MDGLTPRELIHELVDTNDDMMNEPIELTLYAPGSDDVLYKKCKIVSANKRFDGSMEAEMAFDEEEDYDNEKE